MRGRKGLARLAAIGVVVPALAGRAAPVACDGSAAAGKAAVLRFYDLALGARRVREAFDRFAARDFVEHSEDTPGGTRDGTVAFLEGLIARFPQGRWEIVRSAGEGDLVFLHVRFTPEPGREGTAIAEIFRVKDCRLAEHWDVIARPPEKPVNPNSRF